MVTKRKATKRKATGMDGFNVLLSRNYLKLEKSFMKIEQSHGKWFGEAEFQGEKLMMKGKTWARVSDALGDKMTSMVKAMDQYTGKKKKRGPGKVRDERRRENNREKLIKKLAREGYWTKLCTDCYRKNMPKYQYCLKCKKDLSGVEAGQEILVFYDIERVNGGEKSQPFSIGLVAMKSDSGEVLKRKEIHMMPENVKDVDWYESMKMS